MFALLLLVFMCYDGTLAVIRFNKGDLSEAVTSAMLAGLMGVLYLAECIRTASKR